MAGESKDPSNPAPPARWVRLLVLVLAAALAIYLIVTAHREHNPPVVEVAPAPEGANSRPAKKKNNFGIAGPSSKADPHMSREEARREAIRAGILDALDAGAKPKR